MVVNTIIHGDALTILQDIQAKSIQCCVTSPPYFGLRDYAHPGQIGLEETPQVYIQKLVAVFREVKRVLKDNGVLWLNLGDSYANSGRVFDGVDQAKNLMGIPWHVAFALQSDGWILRSDCIWNKPNCLPESVQDRPTKAHEYIFLLAKCQRYYYNADAIREPVTEYRSYRGTKDVPIHAYPGNPQSYAKGRSGFGYSDTPGRNRRSVWSISTASYIESHFATMPPKLAELCILAGSRSGDIILDPFCGAGTTPLVALQHNRQYLGIELNANYIRLAQKRIATTQTVLWSLENDAI